MLMRQQLVAQLSAVHESHIQVLLHIARTDSNALLEEKKAQMIGKVAPSFINPLLSDLQLSIEMRMLGQVQSLLYSQLPDKDTLGKIV